MVKLTKNKIREIKEERERYVVNNKSSMFLALDLSLANSGVSVFSKSGNFEKVYSIATTSAYERGERLKSIADHLLEDKCNYCPDLVVIEKSFSRYTASTQALYEVLGVVQYVFYDLVQVFYSPASVKKALTGDGRSEKDVVQNAVKKYIGNVNFQNFDESDACAVGITYLLDKGIVSRK